MTTNSSRNDCDSSIAYFPVNWLDRIKIADRPRSPDACRIMTWRLRCRASRMKNRGVVGLKVSHVLSSSAFCEKEQSGREYERGGGSVGSRWGGKKKKEQSERRERQRSSGRAGGMKTGAALSASVNVHARMYTRTYSTVTHRRIADGAHAPAQCVVYATAARKRTCARRARLLRAGKSSRSRGRPTPESRILFYERSGPRTCVF